MRGGEKGGGGGLPLGITAPEAAFILEVFARLKGRRFGRLVVTVSDGRIVDVELQEKVDRRLFAAFWSAADQGRPETAARSGQGPSGNGPRGQ